MFSWPWWPRPHACVLASSPVFTPINCCSAWSAIRTPPCGRKMDHVLGIPPAFAGRWCRRLPDRLQFRLRRKFTRTIRWLAIRCRTCCPFIWSVQLLPTGQPLSCASGTFCCCGAAVTLTLMQVSKWPSRKRPPWLPSTDIFSFNGHIIFTSTIVSSFL